jgi:hypothetical protein
VGDAAQVKDLWGIDPVAEAEAKKPKGRRAGQREPLSSITVNNVNESRQKLVDVRRKLEARRANAEARTAKGRAGKKGGGQADKQVAEAADKKMTAAERRRTAAAEKKATAARAKIVAAIAKLRKQAIACKDAGFMGPSLAIPGKLIWRSVESPDDDAEEQGQTLQEMNFDTEDSSDEE